MREVAFTFGIGDYAEAAAVCARQWELVHGQELIVLGEDAVDTRWPVHWNRFLAFRLFPDVDRIVQVDADVFAVGRVGWNPFVDFEAGDDCWEYVRGWAESVGISRYFNSGLWRASRAMAPVFEAALGMYGLPGYGGQCGDQHAMNFAVNRMVHEHGWLMPGVHRLLFPHRDLPYERGNLVERFPEAAVFHFTSMSARGGEIGRVMRGMEG
jgi:hypothetical protein